MPTATLRFLPDLPQITLISIVDILVVAVAIYHLISVIRGRRAAAVIFGIAVLGAVYLVAAALGLELLRTVLATLAPYTAIALIVIFQSELRRLLARLGQSPPFRFAGRIEKRDVIRDVVFAAAELAPRKVGALIVLERDIGLRTFVESGTKLDAAVSSDLLLSIFEPKTRLHDGAVIIQGDRIAAAACFLPLTMNQTLARTYGTRHRAAIGITEEADCIAVVVSEETGRISVAAFGELEPVNEDALEQRLIAHVRRRDRPGPGSSVNIQPAETQPPVEESREAQRR